MEWFSQKTSIAGIQISNWILVVVAILVIWIISHFGVCLWALAACARCGPLGHAEIRVSVQRPRQVRVKLGVSQSFQLFRFRQRRCVAPQAPRTRHVLVRLEPPDCLLEVVPAFRTLKPDLMGFHANHQVMPLVYRLPRQRGLPISSLFAVR